MPDDVEKGKRTLWPDVLHTLVIVGQLKPHVVRSAITFNSRANHKHRRNTISLACVCAKEAVMEILIGYKDQNAMMITVLDYQYIV